MEDLPLQVQQQLVQFQQVQAQLQVFAAQRQQVQAQGREIEHALEALEKVGDDAPVYRSAGALLIRTAGKAEVAKELQGERETLEVRAKSLEKQEARLKERHDELQAKLQAALGRGGGSKGQA